MSSHIEIDRIRSEYADRDIRLAGKVHYSPLNVSALFSAQQRQRQVIQLLRKQYQFSISDKVILEIGSGIGGVLLEYLNYGAVANNLFGIDLILQRLRSAKCQVPYFQISCANGELLPFQDNTFDMILQYTVFTSILSKQIKQNIAEEMLRVIKPGGLLIWYDFWWNPTNLQTRGIPPKEIRQLFPNCDFEFHKVTLAPPLARWVVPISWIAAVLLEKVVIFNTHYLVAIHPQK